MGLAMGAVLGAAQAVTLHGRVRHPWRWVPANMAAWSPTMAIIFLGASYAMYRLLDKRALESPANL